MPEWRVQLQGNTLDLQELNEILSNQDPSIIQENNEFFVKSKAWDQLQEGAQVLENAKRLVGLLDNAAYIHFRNSSPFSIGDIVRIDDDGQKHRMVYGEANIILGPVRLKATAIVTGLDGKPIENKQEHPIITTLRVSKQHVQVSDALRFFRKGDWLSLYKAYEIVRDEIGEQEIIRRKWLTKKSKKRFTQTAQSRDVLGDNARHASRKFKPPNEPMLIDEANAIIGDLLQKWIDYLHNKSPNSEDHKYT